ncbi:hypothetical protein GCM10010221_58650 [Streptomyces parvus]|nr:hypothetical protein GCM10010221_58650 [Streptomyces parvus]
MPDQHLDIPLAGVLVLRDPEEKEPRTAPACRHVVKSAAAECGAPRGVCCPVQGALYVLR